jgi:hypothetical protein
MVAPQARRDLRSRRIRVSRLDPTASSGNPDSRALLSRHAWRRQGCGGRRSQLVDVIGPGLHHRASFRKIPGVVVGCANRVSLAMSDYVSFRTMSCSIENALNLAMICRWTDAAHA